MATYHAVFVGVYHSELVELFCAFISPIDVVNMLPPVPKKEFTFKCKRRREQKSILATWYPWRALAPQAYHTPMFLYRLVVKPAAQERVMFTANLRSKYFGAIAQE